MASWFSPSHRREMDLSMCSLMGLHLNTHSSEHLCVQKVPGVTLKICQKRFLVNLKICVHRKVAVLFRYTSLSTLLPVLVPYLFFR